MLWLKQSTSPLRSHYLYHDSQSYLAGRLVFHNHLSFFSFQHTNLLGTPELQKIFHLKYFVNRHPKHLGCVSQYVLLPIIRNIRKNRSRHFSASFQETLRERMLMLSPCSFPGIDLRTTSLFAVTRRQNHIHIFHLSTPLNRRLAFCYYSKRLHPRLQHHSEIFS